MLRIGPRGLVDFERRVRWVTWTPVTPTMTMTFDMMSDEVV